ncbi:hypothetical protein BDV97DRAFT_358202 [Delphinella strobiligena]|nr:hypothetical protein BDV97DRAFT_358202 [Delphinella strobiligena]
MIALQKQAKPPPHPAPPRQQSPQSLQEQPRDPPSQRPHHPESPSRPTETTKTRPQTTLNSNPKATGKKKVAPNKPGKKAADNQEKQMDVPRSSSFVGRKSANGDDSGFSGEDVRGMVCSRIFLHYARHGWRTGRHDRRTESYPSLAISRTQGQATRIGHNHHHPDDECIRFISTLLLIFHMALRSAISQKHWTSDLCGTQTSLIHH